ncbi:MAG TPA: catechol 1,2-dioxygenase [Acidimicrobiia bacterium]
MGEIVGAAVLGHQPTIMLPAEQRVRLGHGRDTTLVAGFDEVRTRLDAAGADTFVIVDTHWFTTFEHVLAGQEHHRGVFTSEEVPRVICDYEYDYAGAPRLAETVHAIAKERGVPTTNVTTTTLPHHYPTLNLVHWLHRDEQVLSIGICQTAAAEDFLELGATLADAVGQSDRRVALLGSGGMSHRFWPLRELADHMAYDPDDVISDAAREADGHVLELWAAGDHAGVIDFYPEFRRHSPEGLFGHYLVPAGAMGGRQWRGRGVQLSEYENSVGTGQVHVWFEAEGKGEAR